jgi:hypothetical protein
MATLVDYAALADAASPRHLQGMCDLDPYLVRREKIAVLKVQAGELPNADLMLAATHELIKLSPPSAALSAPRLEKSTLRRRNCISNSQSKQREFFFRFGSKTGSSHRVNRRIARAAGAAAR